MKTLFTLLLFSLITAAFAQDPFYEEIETKERQLDEGVLSTIKPLPVNRTSNKIEYRDVIEVPGKSEEQIYTEARAWISRTFNSATATIELSAEEETALTGKGTFISVISVHPEGLIRHLSVDIRFLLSIDVKEGKYRYTLTDLEVRDPSGSYYLPAEDRISDELLYRKKGKFHRNNLHTRKGVQVAVDGILASLTSAITVPEKQVSW